MYDWLNFHSGIVSQGLMNHFLRLTDEGATTPKPVLDWNRLYKLS